MVRMSESTFLASDGQTSLYYREYIPEAEAVGVVQIVHGLAEHIGRYDSFAHFLAENGFLSVLYDLPGHGRTASEGKAEPSFGELGNWEDNIEDLHRFHDRTAARYPGKPYFLFGHSMGSFLARGYVIRFRTGLDGIILSGTGQQSKLLLQSMRLVGDGKGLRRTSDSQWKRVALAFMNHRFLPGRGSYDWLSRDEKEVDSFETDPLCGVFSAAELMSSLAELLRYIAKPKNLARMNRELPVFFFSGTCDPVGEEGRGVIRSYKSFLHAGMRDVTMKLYPDGRHEMLHETNASEVYRDVLDWLNAKIGRG